MSDNMNHIVETSPTDIVSSDAVTEEPTVLVFTGKSGKVAATFDQTHTAVPPEFKFDFSVKTPLLKSTSKSNPGGALSLFKTLTSPYAAENSALINTQPSPESIALPFNPSSEGEDLQQADSYPENDCGDQSFESDDCSFYDARTTPEREDSPADRSNKLLKILPNILHYVTETSDSYKTLYSLSLVCKAFSPLALDALWRVLPDITPLYHLLPCQLVHGNTWVYNSMNPVFDWATFHEYAKRVNGINLASFQNVSDAEILMSISRLHPEPLLPNLSFVQIDEIQDCSPSTLLQVLYFFSPSVSSLSLNGVPEISMTERQGHAAVLSLLKVLAMTPSYCTDAFTELSISGVFSHHLLDHILLFRSLKHLTISASHSQIPLAFIESIASLQHLESFELSLDSPSASMDRFVHETALGNEGDFSRLQHLRLRGFEADIDTILYLFQIRWTARQVKTVELTYAQVENLYHLPKTVVPLLHIAFPRIRHLRVSVLSPMLDDSKRTRTSLIDHTPQLEDITTIGVIANSLPKVSRSTRVDMDAVLWDLLEFQEGIRTLEFWGFQILCNSPPSFFSNLQVLRLPCSNNEETLTLHDLAGLASNMPRLRVLSLYVSLENLGDEEALHQLIKSVVGKPTPHHALEQLFINNTDEITAINASAVVVFGQFIHLTFPALKKVGVFEEHQVDDTPSSESGIHANWWRGVFRQIQILQLRRSKTQPLIF
ncbi:hypothetical protein CVT24_003038 [Panaeolus cyanescens]|uniref:F-box domain-containing protein n=1 Tax=Panaeolus cyanescens TaxID=181874 RepID=A0A409VFQ1_9AGAR|nr:hypothetical protein CVT24_003038 [Panaeolus cyanescens]